MVTLIYPPFNKFRKIFKDLPDNELGEFTVSRFPNQEMYVTLDSNVKDTHCFMLSSISPPDKNLLSFLLLAHTLKKERASKITAILPYLAYSRQDKDKKGQSLAASAVGGICQASHIDEIVTIDIHSPKVGSLFPIPVYSLSPAKVFAEEVKKLKLENLTFVAPDEGAKERCKAVADEVGSKAPISYMKKERTPTGVSSVLYGQVNPDVVVVDDILDTGGTLLACCTILKNKGAENIYICITHGLFTGHIWEELFNLNVKQIYCTDSIPEVEHLSSKNINILSIEPLLRQYLAIMRKDPKEQTHKSKKPKEEEILLLPREQ